MAIVAGETDARKLASLARRVKATTETLTCASRGG